MPNLVPPTQRPLKALSYERTVLHSTEAFEIVACDWTSKSVSALHDHGWSQCSILVHEGQFENTLDLGLKTEVRVYGPGEVITTPLAAKHEIRCLTPHGKTLHVYTPRLVEEDKVLLFATPSLGELKEKIDLKLGPSGMNWSPLEALLKNVSKKSVTTNSPYFMNQLFSGVLPETLLAEDTVHRSRTTMATYEASPVFTAIELEVVDRLGELIGWSPEDRDGVGVPGGSAANFLAIHCARQKRIPEFRKRGSSGEKFKVFVSKAAHYSVTKACLATGLGTDSLIAIPCDADGRMNVQDLKVEMEHAKTRGEIPLMVCATAGTTVHGAFDPIDQIAAVCQATGTWLHVDAAWGGPALFSKKARAHFKGVDQADSLTFDAHKLFGSGLTSSFFLTRHHGLLFEANDSGGGDYLFHASEADLDRGRSSWQCGRGPDAVSFWTLWKSQGTDGLGRFVDRLFQVRDETLKWIKDEPRLQLVSEPAYLNVCVRIKSTDPEASRKAREKLKEQNFAFVNFSIDEKGPFLRLILANPKTDFEIVRNVLQKALEVQS